MNNWEEPNLLNLKFPNEYSLHMLMMIIYTNQPASHNSLLFMLSIWSRNIFIIHTKYAEVTCLMFTSNNILDHLAFHVVFFMWDQVYMWTRLMKTFQVKPFLNCPQKNFLENQLRRDVWVMCGNINLEDFSRVCILTGSKNLMYTLS
jgi:hypothetical protein